MTYLRTGLLGLSASLILLGCGNLWRPFLVPGADSSPSCGSGADPSCDLSTPGPNRGDGPIATGPTWINESQPTLPDLKSVYMVKPGQAYAVGDRSTIVQWQVASNWVVLNTQQVGTPYMSISGNTANNLWIAGADGSVSSYNGVSLLTQHNPCSSLCPSGFTSLWTTPTGYPWVVGLANQAYKTPDGTMTWNALNVPSAFGQNLFAIWGVNAGDLWIGSGDGSAGTQLYHYLNSVFQGYPVPEGLTVNAIWGRNASDVWAVGEEGLIMHWNGLGSGWKQINVPAAGDFTLRSVAGNNAGEVWVVGDAGLILHYDGTTWQKSDAMVQNILYGVAVSPLDSYPLVVGAKGTLLRLASSTGTGGTMGTL